MLRPFRILLQITTTLISHSNNLQTYLDLVSILVRRPRLPSADCVVFDI